MKFDVICCNSTCWNLMSCNERRIHHIHARARVHTQQYTCTRTHFIQHVQTCKHKSMQTFMLTYIYTYIHIYARTYVHRYVNKRPRDPSGSAAAMANAGAIAAAQALPQHALHQHLAWFGPKRGSSHIASVLAKQTTTAKKAAAAEAEARWE